MTKTNLIAGPGKQEIVSVHFALPRATARLLPEPLIRYCGSPARGPLAADSDQKLGP